MNPFRRRKPPPQPIIPVQPDPLVEANLSVTVDPPPPVQERLEQLARYEESIKVNQARLRAFKEGQA
jgi:hypothetical protein